MKQSNKLSSSFAIIIGIFFLVEGIWGLFSEVTFGIFTTNIMHAVIHLILGITGITLGFKKNALGFCMFLGVLLLVVGILHFIPGTSQLETRLINANDAIAFFNIVVGAFSLLVAYSAKHRVVAH